RPSRGSPTKLTRSPGSRAGVAASPRVTRTTAEAPRRRPRSGERPARTPRPALASLHRRVRRGPPDLVPDPGHDGTVLLRFRTDPEPFRIGAECGPGPLAVGQVLEPAHVVEDVGGADHGLPEAQHLDAVPLEESDGVVLEPGMHGRHAARNDLIAAQLVD